MQLLTTLALMFFGALACGCAPFFLRVKDTHLQTVAALGAGLMIGSALAVIIPEGFHAFAEAGSHAHEHDHDHEEEPGHEEHEEGLPEGLAGLVLICGFLAMLLLDHLQHAAGGSCGTPGHTHAHHHHARSHSHGNGDCVSASAGQERQKDRSPERQAAAGQKGTAAGSSDAGHVGEPRAEAADCTGKAKKGAAAPPPPPADPQSAITGLLIHCAADGLAMGAAFLSGDARLTMLIAAAMVLHKAPMAFGLATYLMACQWTFQRSQKTLLLFAAAAPAATLATYGLLGSLAVLSSPGAVALCVLFSGGTFLYAATMHILPEVLQSGGGGGHARMSSSQLAAVALGSLLPVALSWGHHH